jgi:hypothetical protein
MVSNIQSRSALSSTTPIDQSPNIRIILGSFILGCTLEVIVHEQNYETSPVLNAIVAFADTGAEVALVTAIYYSILLLFRIAFMGYGFVMMLPTLVGDDSRQNDSAAVENSAVERSAKRES